MFLKNFARKLVYKEKSSSDSYISYLRGKGMKIGDDCIIYAPTKTLIDEQYPWMISIGNNVRITQGVIILTHDFSWSVLKLYESKDIKKGLILGSSGKVTIGNNVFIGMNSIITRNVNIGNNVIIGAGSIVTKDCEDNGVYAGNPAKKIMEVDDYYKKRYKIQLNEAKDLALEYYKRYKKIPPKDIFTEYFMIFESKKEIEMNEKFLNQAKLCGNYEDTVNSIPKIKKFLNYDEFIRWCLNENK